MGQFNPVTGANRPLRIPLEIDNSRILGRAERALSILFIWAVLTLYNIIGRLRTFYVDSYYK